MNLRQGNVFTPVCHSVHREVSVWWVSVQGVSVKGALCPGGLCQRGSLSRGSLSKRLSVQGVSVKGALCPGGLCQRGSLSRGSLSRRDLCPGGLCPGGLCPGLSVQGGSLSRRSPSMVTCGCYASYWNAFLLLFAFDLDQFACDDMKTVIELNQKCDGINDCPKSVYDDRKTSYDERTYICAGPGKISTRFHKQFYRQILTSCFWLIE